MSIMTIQSQDMTDLRWQAVLERDASAGGFFYAVSSTGVFCRPGCPSRRPSRTRVEFFDSLDAALAAGYRPCRRCKPDEQPAEAFVVEQVRALVEESETEPTLDALAGATGLSPSHLQRLFKRATGTTPKQYAAARRLDRFKSRLRDGDSVTSGIFDAGFGSSRALYDTETRSLGMRPRAYRQRGRGESIVYAVVASALGPMIVAATRYGLCFVGWGEREKLLGDLETEFSEAQLAEDRDALGHYIDAIDRYLSGEPAGELELDLRGTAFQLAVWQALRAIPPGETRSYGQLAADLGMPGSARAVGRANAQNRLPPFIPCHRLIGSDGSLTGYRWGLERKRALLDIEQGAYPATGEAAV